MIEKQFHAIFDQHPATVAAAPGRVNLIGEHLDYNGGMVLPTALSVGLSVALRPRNDNKVRIASDRFEGLIEKDLGTKAAGHWADYAVGAVIYANESEYLDGGADIYATSTIPDGAGLSSSAALIVATLKASRDMSGASASDETIAQLARRVENEYIGVPCGIMDQMAVAIARQGQAIALDTKTLRYTLISLPAEHHFAVIHSGQNRSLSDGRYAMRKQECDEARQILEIPDLCLLDNASDKKLDGLPEPINRRARHCVTEHRRTVRAAIALNAGDMDLFGALMNESHHSMRDDFEISLPEIDALIENARRFGAMGARLTGGGFGGCIVACVAKDRLSEWTAAILGAHPHAKLIA